MTKNENFLNQGFNLVELIKALLNNTKPVLKDANFKHIYQLAKIHSLQNMLYYAINHYQKFGYKDVNVEVLKQLTKDHQFAITRTATQEAELEVLEQEFEANKIDYCVLKGSVLKHYYPSVDMRSMADIDIYFDKTKVKDVKKLMLKLGYRVETYKKGNHDCYLKDPFMNLEMHRELVHDRLEFTKYYDDYFKNLVKVDGKEHKYEFKEEDFYLFLTAHSAKHCAEGGTGIRTIVDQFIYLENKKDVLDREYLKVELEKLGLNLYEENLTKLAYFWFSKEDMEKHYKDRSLKKEYELMMKMSNFIFGSGTYGTVQNAILNDFVGEDEIKNLRASKFKNLMKLAFPPYSFMKDRYPCLRKLPLLLPFTYLHRLIKAAFKNKDTVKSKYSNNSNVTIEQIEEHRKTQEEIGYK